MKTSKTESKIFKNKTAFLSTLIALTLLAGCCGTNAQMDMMTAKANGTIEKSDRISAEELNRILNNHFGNVIAKFTDYEYSLPDNGKVAELSNSANCNAYPDNPARMNGWDCDDYAIAAMIPLRNYAFGAMYVKTASGVRHAMNVFVNRNKEVVYWEPQSCDYYHGEFHKPDLIFF